MRLPTEMRQTEIVAAALHLAKEVSPALITTSEIAQVVGISQGAVFKHFPSKDAIWVAAMEWVGVQLLATLEAAAHAEHSPVAGLGSVFHAHVAFVIAHPGVPRVIFHELQQPADSATKQQVRLLLQNYRKLLLRLLDEAVQQGELAPALNREAGVTLFIGIVQGLVMQSMLAGKPSTMKTQADAVFALYLHGLYEGAP